MRSAISLLETANLSAINLCKMVLHDAAPDDIKRQAQDTITAQFMATGPILTLADILEKK